MARWARRRAVWGTALLLEFGLLGGCSGQGAGPSPCHYDIYKDRVSCTSNS